eukprot:TRINITY_DN2265_c0_g1_i1.p1 TRINITY_DN2265_c0_g1~~TRINITY_DN2265_c0_g1_i1.p1  ORF type:complete len:609 (-),score=197.96 TRINITY_DN2265_c0_g1_i1:220-2046(-)
MSGLKFSEHFWGPGGYEAIDDLLNNGRTSCVAITTFLTDWTKAQDKHGKVLDKIINKFKDSVRELPSVQAAWNMYTLELERDLTEMNKRTENVKTNILANLVTMTADTANHRKVHMTEAQKQLALYKSLTNNLAKARESYEKASMKARDTSDQLSQMKMANEKASKLKGKEKALESDRKAAAASDEAYKDALNKVTSFLPGWIDAMQKTYQEVQTQDHLRTQALVTALNNWTLALKPTETFNKDSIDTIQAVIKRVDTTKDLNSWIRTNQKETSPPDMPQYYNWDAQPPPPPGSTVGTRRVTSNATPPQEDLPTPTSSSTPPPAATNHSSSDNNTNSFTPVSPRGPPPSSPSPTPKIVTPPPATSGPPPVSGRPPTNAGGPPPRALPGAPSNNGEAAPATGGWGARTTSSNERKLPPGARPMLGGFTGARPTPPSNGPPAANRKVSTNSFFKNLKDTVDDFPDTPPSQSSQEGATDINDILGLNDDPSRMSVSLAGLDDALGEMQSFSFDDVDDDDDPYGAGTGGNDYGSIGTMPTWEGDTVDDVPEAGDDYIGWAEATFDYDAGDEDELPFVEGDRIHLLAKDDSGWWSGECNGRVGLFPANHVREV